MENRSGNISAVAQTLYFSQMCVFGDVVEAQTHALRCKAHSLIIALDKTGHSNFYSCVHDLQSKAAHVSSSVVRLPRKCQTTNRITACFCPVISESLTYFHQIKSPNSTATLVLKCIAWAEHTRHTKEVRDKELCGWAGDRAPDNSSDQMFSCLKDWLQPFLSVYPKGLLAAGSEQSRAQERSEKSAHLCP